ncbi:MAG: DUF4403 family protein [Anditalea sp.]
MIYRSLIIFLFFCAFISCKKINPDKPTFKGDPVSLPKAVSKINVPLEIPLSYIEDHLNNGVKELLYEEKDLSVSNGLFTDISVFRTGKISLLGNGNNSLSIKLPMRLEGNLKIEKKIFGQMISTSIPYEETLLPEVSFSPEVGKNWDISINNLQIESWGRSLQYNFMGFTIDFDPIIRTRIENILNNQLSSNGVSRISFKEAVEKTWEAYGEPMKIEQGNVDAYIYTIPHKVKVSEKVTSDQKLQINIGLEGEVFTQIGERPNFNPSPLPAVLYNEDEDILNQISITLPLAITYNTLDQYLNQELVGKAFKLDGKTNLIPKELTTQSFGDRALLKMAFTVKRTDKKDLKGELFLVGKPTYDMKSEAIVFEDIDFDINTKSILANSANWLKQRQFLDEIKKHAVYPIGPYIKEARLQLQEQGYINTDFASFRVKNTELDVNDIYITEDDIRLYLKATGQMEVRLKESNVFWNAGSPE